MFFSFILKVGEIVTGCVKTPLQGSFFCADHKLIGDKYTFRYRKKTMLLDLNTIRPKVGRIKYENLVIHDSFVDRNDNVLLLVDYSDDSTGTFFWVTSNQILATKVEAYIEQLKNFKKDVDPSCSSSKIYTLPCVKKTRTVGMFLSCFNCGIIAGYREIFGSETTAQAVALFLFMIDNTKHWPKVNFIQILISI